MLDRRGHLPHQIEEITRESSLCTPEFLNCCSWGPIWLWDLYIGVDQILLQAQCSKMHNSTTNWTRSPSNLEVYWFRVTFSELLRYSGTFRPQVASRTREHSDLVLLIRVTPKFGNTLTSCCNLNITRKVHFSLVCISRFVLTILKKYLWSAIDPVKIIEVDCLKLENFDGSNFNACIAK